MIQKRTQNVDERARRRREETAARAAAAAEAAERADAEAKQKQVREILADWDDLAIRRAGPIWSIAGVFKGRPHFGGRIDPIGLAVDLRNAALAEYEADAAHAQHVAGGIEADAAHAENKPEKDPPLERVELDELGRVPAEVEALRQAETPAAPEPAPIISAPSSEAQEISESDVDDVGAVFPEFATPPAPPRPLTIERRVVQIDPLDPAYWQNVGDAKAALLVLTNREAARRVGQSVTLYERMIELEAMKAHGEISRADELELEAQAGWAGERVAVEAARVAIVEALGRVQTIEQARAFIDDEISNPDAWPVPL